MDLFPLRWFPYKQSILHSHQDTNWPLVVCWSWLWANCCQGFTITNQGDCSGTCLNGFETCCCFSIRFAFSVYLLCSISTWIISWKFSAPVWWFDYRFSVFFPCPCIHDGRQPSRAMDSNYWCKNVCSVTWYTVHYSGMLSWTWCGVEAGLSAFTETSHQSMFPCGLVARTDSVQDHIASRGDCSGEGDVVLLPETASDWQQVPLQQVTKWLICGSPVQLLML